ncbi:IS1634 family transposase [Desulfonatronospira sp.]|uniref:IS1634 family transposase n=1 Tax=Desulfonatronospira sp. TaxID=1962951 RepID=UPI0025C6D493|nr:IS1634 family transposase [Desulfonatronospira sp.]
MFIRVKGTGRYRYLQVVENHREGKRTLQRVICTLGRADELMASGAADNLLRSLARFGERVRLMEMGDLEKGLSQKLGPDLVFGRLWQATGIQAVLADLLRNRSFEFPVERAIYLTVLHRLFGAGSDRKAERWRRDVAVPGTEDIDLHHLYRAMRWLGEAKDEVEETLFGRRRDLFTELSLAFFDTTSIYFEGQGGESIGQYGHSKDHRPDLRQMVVGAVLTGDGRPVCSELWPGKQADGKALLPVVDRLRQRFGLTRVCWVADRGMISKGAIEGLEDRKLEYILGARMRRQKEVSEAVLSRAGRYQEVTENLRVKEARIEGRRYIICLNPAEAKKDAEEREAIVMALEDEIRQGALQLVGNRGYRRFLRVEKGAVAIDRKKVEAEARYDGKFVLRTNTALPAGEVAVQYKRLLQVEQFFRATKSLLNTRPIFHRWDATIRGHVFCSFLALVLMDELKRRLAARGEKAEWDVIRQDLEALDQAEVRQGDHWYLLRGPLQGVAGKVLQAAGVAVPPPVRPTENVVPRP